MSGWVGNRHDLTLAVIFIKTLFQRQHGGGISLDAVHIYQCFSSEGELSLTLKGDGVSAVRNPDLQFDVLRRHLLRQLGPANRPEHPKELQQSIPSAWRQALALPQACCCMRPSFLKLGHIWMWSDIYIEPGARDADARYVCKYLLREGGGAPRGEAERDVVRALLSRSSLGCSLAKEVHGKQEICLREDVGHLVDPGTSRGFRPLAAAFSRCQGRGCFEKRPL